MARDTLHVLDGTALLFRHYFGKIKLTSPQDVEVGAVLGLCSSVARHMREHQPSHVAVVFDAGPKTFRNELYPLYKANRGEPPEDLVPQFDLAIEAIRAMGLPVYLQVGWEADDLMATLARMALGWDMDCVIVASDKDLLQCVRPGVRVMNPRNGQLFDEAGVEAKLGVRPDQVVDYQAMVGDAVDNLPGVKGVGAKSAAQLLQELDSIEGIYADLEKVLYIGLRGAKGVQTKLLNAREQVELGRRMVRLVDDVPHPELRALAGPEGWRWQGLRHDADQVFASMGFSGPLRMMRALS